MNGSPSSNVFIYMMITNMHTYIYKHILWAIINHQKSSFDEDAKRQRSVPIEVMMGAGAE